MSNETKASESLEMGGYAPTSVAPMVNRLLLLAAFVFGSCAYLYVTSEDPRAKPKSNLMQPTQPDFVELGPEEDLF